MAAFGAGALPARRGVPQAEGMDASKLFKVLVIGGAMLGLACEPAAVPDEDGGDARDAAPTPGDAALADAASPEDGGSAVAPGGDAGEPIECGLCPNDDCCETAADGTSTTRPGMMCCWGTSC